DVAALLKVTGGLEAFSFEAAEHPALRPGQTARVLRESEPVGWLGVIHPHLQRTLDLRRPVLLFSLQLDLVCRSRVPSSHAFPKFPTVRRGLALLVAERTTADALMEQAKIAAGELLQRVVIFDVYTGAGIDSGRKSIA